MPCAGQGLGGRRGAGKLDGKGPACSGEAAGGGGRGPCLGAGRPEGGEGAFGVFCLSSRNRTQNGETGVADRAPTVRGRSRRGDGGVPPTPGGLSPRSRAHVRSGRRTFVQQGGPWRVSRDLSGRVWGMRRERETGYRPERGRPRPAVPRQGEVSGRPPSGCPLRAGRPGRPRGENRGVLGPAPSPRSPPTDLGFRLAEAAGRGPAVGRRGFSRLACNSQSQV